MVNRVIQDRFKILPNGSAESSEPLVVHRHANAPETTQSIILVHGLNGQRYKTWGNMPGFLFEDYPSVDVGLYDYSSGMRRLRRASSVQLEDHARHLAETIGEEGYAQTILVGHSMGGLLCMAAVRCMIDSGLNVHSDGTPTVRHVAGVILMASPLAGSLRAVWPFNRLSRDVRVLRAHGRFVQAIGSCFTNQLVTSCAQNGPIGERYCVPTYAAIALGDRWVDGYSAGVGIPANQQRHVHRSHKSIVKPLNRDDDAYKWLSLRIKDCFGHAPVCKSIPSNIFPDVGQTADGVELTIEQFERIKKDLPPGARLYLRDRDWGA